jgi:hypothetical protein
MKRSRSRGSTTPLGWTGSGRVKAAASDLPRDDQDLDSSPGPSRTVGI